MRPVRLSLSGAGSTKPVVLDTYQAPFNVGIGVVLSDTPNMTFTVEHTYDDVFANNFNPATATWLASAITGTASTTGNYTIPVTAIRLTVAPHTSGTATMTVVQAGMPGR